MMTNRFILLALILTIFFINSESYAQKFAIGGRGGLSIFSSQGSSAGLQLGPTFDVEFAKGMRLGSDLLLNTQGGTPFEWSNYFKYMIEVPKSEIEPYVNGGFGLWFLTGGPYFGLQFGGGAYIKIAPNLYVPADIQLGPVFTSGSSTFYFAMTSGIRYILPNR